MSSLSLSLSLTSSTRVQQVLCLYKGMYLQCTPSRRHPFLSPLFLMARFPSPHFPAAPPAAAIAGCPLDQPAAFLDHQLLDLLWFYDCSHTARAPSPLSNATLHGSGSGACAADHTLLADAQDIEYTCSALLHPAPRCQPNSINTALIHSLHQSLKKNGGWRNSACSDIMKPGHPALLHQRPPAPLNVEEYGQGIAIGYFPPSERRRLWAGGAKDGAVSINAKVNKGPDDAPQQCQPSGKPASAKWLRQVFDAFDENKDGMLSTEELRRSLEKLGIETSDESMDSLLGHRATKDEKTLVSRDDFRLLYEGGSSCTQCGHNNEENMQHIDCKWVNEKGAHEDLLWGAFNVFDKDCDGFISPIELQSVLRNLGFGAAQELHESTEMIKRYDQDGDEEVDFEEFKAMLDLAEG